MTWGVIDLIEELKARIKNAKTSGGLEYVSLYVGGDWDEIRKGSDFPTVVIRPSSLTIIPECMKHGTVEDTTIVIQYVTNKKHNYDNTLYNTTDSSGMLYNLAILLNYLEKKTSDNSVDLTVNGKTYNLAKPDVTFNYSDKTLIVANIRFKVEIAKFTRGAR